MRNLRIDELFIGAWVRRFSTDGCTLSAPMRVCGLSARGRVQIETADDEDAMVINAPVEELCPVQMDEDSMRGFGFVRVPKGENVWMTSVRDIRLTVSLRQKFGRQECRRAAISGRFACWNEEIRYVHELQAWWRDKVLMPYGLELCLSWRGGVKEREEL